MSFKTILFCLFLYICLVWVGAGYYYSGPNIEQFGLMWTAVGLFAVLALTLLSRIWGSVRILRSRAAARPKPLVKAVTPVAEDEMAVKSLLAEATATLRRAPAYADKGADLDLSMLPLYLLVGPEASGKTTNFINSGLSPQLLAGDATGQAPFLPTRLCNLWLAQNALFVEIGGRAFVSDRLPHILRPFQSRPAITGWRRWFAEPARPFEIRGVVAFSDVKDFTGPSTPQARERLDRQSREWQERIGRLAEITGVTFPLYFLLTKCDTLPYFSDYFRRILETEAEQVLGCAVTTGVLMDGTDQAAVLQSKRLAKSFTALYHALAERRLQYLSHEPDPARRHPIYEFPRELKRIRPAVVQFLTTVFRPHPLRANPQLLGYYFSGMGERALMPVVVESGSNPEWADRSSAMEASVLFRPDATQMLGRGDVSTLSKVSSPAGTTRRWLFLTELFQDIVLRNRQLPLPVAPDRAVERNKKILCAAICTACALLCVAFATSWMRNLDLLNDLKQHADLHRLRQAPTLPDLQALETLRSEVARLSQYERTRAPLSMRWGLYAGNGVVTAARQLYFQRFQELLLHPLNNGITTPLQGLSPNPPADAPYSPFFKLLQAHLMIAGVCKPEAGPLSEALKTSSREMLPALLASDWQALANRQIDFYTQELAYGNPVNVPTNAAARDRARQYLSQIRGVERIYARVLADVERSVTARLRLRDLSPDYAAVLVGPDEINAAFSKDGWALVEKASKSGNSTNAAEACVLGESKTPGFLGGSDTQTEQAIQKLFVADYVHHWRKFIEAFSLRGYAGAADAAHKLDLLSDHKSPLLALMAMASNQTNFPAPTAEPPMADRAKSLVTKFIPSLGTAAQKRAALSPAPGGEAIDLLSRPSDIARYFQPVHLVVPPGSDTWVTDKNGPYIEALAQLGHAMQDLARSPAPDPALTQAVSQNHDKALDAAKALARGFEPLGVGGLDTTVERLLEAPIRGTDRYIIDPVNAAAGKVNGQLQPLCAQVRSTLSKYPFHASAQDATMPEVAGLFAPGSGAIWKFQADALGDFTLKEGQTWKSKDPSKKPQVTQDMLNFLNRSQAVMDAFYPAGSTQPRFSYTLRPKLDPAYKDAVLELEMDGQVNAWTSSLQKQFTWPVSGPGKTGVVGRIKTGPIAFPFASRGGIWAIFRVMGDAEPRPLGSKFVEWRYVRGGDGRMEEIQPAPVRLEFVEFPGNVDLFNPRFFDGLQCPRSAVQP